MAFPNVLLAGAPKCATSSVYRWLLAQPDIVGGSRKEMYYLMDAGHPLANPKRNLHRDGLEGYARLFPSESDARHRIDATTHYLYQATALRVASELAEPPKVLFVLREPAARVYTSYRYSQTMLGALDPTLEFERFLGLVRRDPPQLGRYCKSDSSRYVLERDLEYGNYVRYLDRWANAIGRERILVVLTEDLRAETEVTLARIANFLELGSETSVEFDASEALEGVGQRTLRMLAERAQAWLDEHPRARQLVSQVYWSMESRDAMPELSDADTRALTKLRDEYAESNAALAERFGLDLTPWSGTPRPSLVD